MLYKFKLGHYATEAIKNLSCAKGKGSIYHSPVTRCFKKFCLGCKNLDNHVKLSRPKIMDSKAMLQSNKKHSESILPIQ